MNIRLNRKGFTLIELLIVVAIIGIIAAIAIPNLLNAIQRGKQKRSMADARAIGTAAEEYAVDNNIYPSGGSDVSAISGVLEPTYITHMPLKDGWNTSFDYVSPSPYQSYTVRSYGKDAAAEALYYGKTTGFCNDIVFSNGQFIEWPEGVQDNC